MLKKVMTLAATTAMLGVNAAAFALNSARAVIKGGADESPASKTAGTKTRTRVSARSKATKRRARSSM